MKKLALLFVIGYLLVFSTPLVWSQGTAHTPEGYNAMLEAHKLKLTDPQKCPSEFVTVKEGKNIFGTTATAYSPADFNAILEAYGLKLIDPQKCPPEFVTVQEGKYIFGTTPIAYDDYNGLLEAYGVKISK
jgi:hypothetical protein